MCAVCDIHYVSTQVGILCSLRVNEHNIPRRVEQDLRGGHPATGGLVLTMLGQILQSLPSVGWGT